MSSLEEQQAACTENWIGAIESLAKIVPNGRIVRLRGATLIKTGLRSPEFNIAFITAKVSDKSRLVNELERVFMEEGLLWQIITSEEAVDGATGAIKKFGLSFKETVPGMVMDYIPNEIPNRPKGLSIKKVKSEEDMISFFETAENSFGGVLFDEKSYSSDISLMTQNLQHFDGEFYLGFADGKPVATSLLFRTGKTAGVYFVGTVPSHRRLGFGESMTWEAILDGKAAGCEMACLQATEMGKPLYQRMGFRTVIDYQLWR